MFNDKYSLTEAVLSGNKTMTRRLITPEPTIARHWSERFRKCSNCFYRDGRGLCELHSEDKLLLPKYKVGEVVAIAQSYKNIGSCIAPDNAHMLAGFSNKMFVKADFMPHHIEIVKVRAERLQDISDEDCLKEGIRKGRVGSLETHYMDAYYPCGRPLEPCCTPRDAFESLIDGISGDGTWRKNPFVWVYEFGLID